VVLLRRTDIRAGGADLTGGTEASRVLLFSATTGYQLRSFNDAAERLGVRLAFATDRCHALDDPWQDAAIPVRFHNETASLRVIAARAAESPFSAVTVVGDRPTLLAAKAAEALGLRGHPPAAVLASASKLRARQAFAAAGLTTPWFRVLQAGDAIEPASFEPGVSGVTYPCVVKPTGLSGSRGVIRADSPAECARAVRRVQALLARRDIRALRPVDRQAILVEGFIPGREYAVEGLLTDGRLQVLAIFDKPDPLDGPFFEETIYVTPPAQDQAGERAIAEAVQQAVTALGLRHGPIHAECRVNGGGVVMLEVAARPIGGLCSRVLVFDGPANGGRASLEELILRHALGEDVSGWRREQNAAAVMMIPIPKRGLLKQVEGEERAREVDGVEDVRITAKRDQLLEPLPEAGSYLGFIFARAASARAAEAAVREAHRRLSFTIDAPIPLAQG
jgi:biotin carboxylase